MRYLVNELAIEPNCVISYSFPMRSLLGSLVSCVLTLIFCSALSTMGQTPKSAFNKDPWPENKEGPIKVFILAGQSNMQGHASLRTLEYLIYNKETAPDYQQWKTMTGDWAKRSDVWVWTTDGKRGGKLKPGFGANEFKLGPELGAGWVLGEHFDEQVAIIKTCWGGRSVKKDFLPPSEPMPSEELFTKDLERMQKRNPSATLQDVKAPYGQAYRDMISHVKAMMEAPQDYYPDYNPEKPRKFEIVGLIWFQGWNDMVDGQQRSEGYVNYTKRLGSLIEDVRKDLNVPDLKVVIGELGASSSIEFHKAQKNVASLPNHKGSTIFVETRKYWDPKLEEMVKNNVWQKENWVDFYNHGSDRGYHYLGSAKMHSQMGKDFGFSMIDLLSD